MIYDAVIVGAGPAGLNCAEALAKAGKSVLILEQNKTIGPKVCAGGLTWHDIEYLKLPESVLDHKYKEIIFHTPFDRDIIKLDKYVFYSVDRMSLGQWQLKKLERTKAIVRTGAKVTNIGKDHIIVNNSEKIRFRNLVGADGSTSIVRRFLGLRTEDRDIAIQYIIPTKRYKKFEFFFDSELFHSWYAWIFPHKDYVSIGCGCDPRYVPSQKLTQNFSVWLKKNKIDISKGKYQACPINFDYKGFQFGKIFLAGDAAGFASGLTGEGIHSALISGEEIAKMIIDKDYVSIKIEELVRMKHFHNRILHLLEKSGPIRRMEYELLAFVLKSKLIDRELIKIMT